MDYWRAGQHFVQVHDMYNLRNVVHYVEHCVFDVAMYVVDQLIFVSLVFV